MSSRATRRGALAAGGGLAAAALAAGHLPAARAQVPEPREAEEILPELIRMEQLLVIAYEALAGQFADDEAAALLRQLRDHEREHLRVLEEDLRERGDEPPEPPARADVEGLDGVRTLDAALELALRLEQDAVDAYAKAASETRAATLLTLGAEIAGSEGQHLVLLRERLGRVPAPEALEGG